MTGRDSSQYMGCRIHPDETGCSRSHPTSSVVTRLHLGGQNHHSDYRWTKNSQSTFHPVFSSFQNQSLALSISSLDPPTGCRWGCGYITVSIHSWGFMRDELLAIRAYFSLFKLDRKIIELALLFKEQPDLSIIQVLSISSRTLFWWLPVHWGLQPAEFGSCWDFCWKGLH